MLKKPLALFLCTSFILLAGCADKKTQPNDSPVSPTPSKSSKVKAEVTKEPHWDQVSHGISLQVKVQKGEDSSNSKPDSPRYKYDVDVDLKNTGSSLLSFDTAEAAFLPGEGGPLRMKTVYGIAEDGRRAFSTIFLRPGDDPTEIKHRLQKVAVLSLRKSKDMQWSYDTNGDTNELLNRSKAAPLIFQFTLISSEKTVAGPFQAALPDLDTLPTSLKGAPPMAVYLKFNPYSSSASEVTAR